jgi:hypothetical protein
MSDGISWAYDSIEREDRLRALGLCVNCEKRQCNCILTKEIKKLTIAIEVQTEEMLFLKTSISELKKNLSKAKANLVRVKKMGKN